MAASAPGRGPERALARLRQLEDAVLALLLGAIVLLASLQIALRTVFDAGIGWADPLVRALVLWVGLLGALAAARGDQHIRIDALPRVVPPRARAALGVATSLFTVAVSGLLSWHAARFVADERALGAVAFGDVPTWWVAAILPLAFGGIALRYALHAALCARGLRSGGAAP